jgi:replication factor C subunit 1
MWNTHTFFFTGDGTEFYIDTVQKFGGLIVEEYEAVVADFLFVGDNAPAQTLATLHGFGKAILPVDDFFEYTGHLQPRVPPPESIDTDEPMNDAVDEDNVIDEHFPPDPTVWSKTPPPEEPVPEEYLLPVDRYAPKTSKELVGNARVVRSVQDFFVIWKMKAKERPARFKKAILLAGAPGVGKTSLAHLLARENGFDVLECNASDVRNKAAVQELLQDAATQYTLNITTGLVEAKAACIIMDEVDGMSSGDRGGAAALAGVIKLTKAPIICICNDKRATALKSLKNMCTTYDLFPPTLSECFPRVKMISELDGANLDDATLRKIIGDCHGDLRQIITMVHMVGLTSDEDKAGYIDVPKTKHSDSPFEGTMQLFSKATSIDDREAIHWNDASMIPLFVQENAHLAAASDDPALLVRAMDSICMGDLIDTEIHTRQNYSLSPAYAFAATVIPTSLLQGKFRGRPEFPTCLGKSSRARASGKDATRILRSCNMIGDYGAFHYLTQLFIRPLVGDSAKENVRRIAETLYGYGLVREDLDIISRLGTIGDSDPIKKVTSAVKSALTRELKKIELEFITTPACQTDMLQVPTWFQ